VLKEVIDGFMSIEKAKSVYGVAIKVLNQGKQLTKLTAKKPVVLVWNVTVERNRTTAPVKYKEPVKG